MERNIYLDDELEDFLKEKSDQYKLYPSDRVWSNINSALHPKFRWSYIAFTLVLLFTSTSITDFTSFAPVSNSYNTVQHSQLVRPETTATVTPLATAEKTYGTDPLIAAVSNVQVSSKQSAQELMPIILPKQWVEAGMRPDEATADWLTSINNTVHSQQATVIHTPDDPASTVVAENATTTPAAIIYDEVASLKTPAQPSGNSIVLVANTASEEDEVGNNVRKVLWAGEPFKRPRMSWQLSFSPTVSYRRLTSGLHEISQVFRGIPYDYNKQATSVDEAVTHKPAIGAEVGIGFNYRVSNSFTVKAGLQLNYSRYQVKAIPIKYQSALLAATPTDSVTVMSSLMNFGGEGSEWLNNKYYQLSLPVGFEWQVLGTSSFKWNVAASAQTVYNVSNNVYLLSTDFRNYGQDPSLIRIWNLSAGVETYLSYNISNHFKLQAGPQLRYQLFSSFKNEYPIKEYLIDLGFKVGITKTLR